jgi:hypothetical protein
MLERKRRRVGHRGPLREIGTITVVAAAILSLCLPAYVWGCRASTPRNAVSDFISARIAGNEEEAAQLTVEEDLSGYAGGEPFLYASDVSYQTGQAETEGDRAVVIVHFSWGDQSADIPYVSRRIGAKWKVALRETEELWLPGVDISGGPGG